MLDCEGSFKSVELIRSLSEMEPSGVSAEVTKSCTNKDHCQSPAGNSRANRVIDSDELVPGLRDLPGYWDLPSYREGGWTAEDSVGIVARAVVSESRARRSHHRFPPLGPTASTSSRSSPHSLPDLRMMAALPRSQ